MSDLPHHEGSSPPPPPALTSSSQASSSPFPPSRHDSDSPNPGDEDWGSEDLAIYSSPSYSPHGFYTGHDSAFYHADTAALPISPTSPSPNGDRPDLSAIHARTYRSSTSKHSNSSSASVYAEHRTSSSSLDIQVGRAPPVGPGRVDAASLFPIMGSTPSFPSSLTFKYDGVGNEVSRKLVHARNSTGPVRREPTHEARTRPAPYVVHPRTPRTTTSPAPSPGTVVDTARSRPAPYSVHPRTPRTTTLRPPPPRLPVTIAWTPHPSRDDSLPGAVAELGPFIMNAAATFHTSCIVCYALKGELADHKLDDCTSGICHTKMNPDYSTFRTAVTMRVANFCFFCNLPQATPVLPFGFHPPNKGGAKNCLYSDVLKPLCYVVARNEKLFERLKTTTQFDLPALTLPEMEEEWITFFRFHESTHLFPNYLRVFLWLLNTQGYDDDNNARLTAMWK